MVQRRIAHKQIPRPFLPHLLRNPLPVQFLLPSRSQRLVHIQTDQISVRRSPSPRLITERHKLNRQFPAALRNIVVHPPRVSLQHSANFRRSIRRRALRRLPHPQSPIFPVVRQPHLTKNLAQIPTRRPPQQIHLPQPVLRHHITLRRHHILQRFRANPRPTPPRRDPQSRHPSIRQSRRFHPVAPAADAPATSSTPSRRRPAAKYRQPNIEKSATRVSFVLAFNLRIAIAAQCSPQNHQPAMRRPSPLQTSVATLHSHAPIAPAPQNDAKSRHAPRIHELLPRRRHPPAPPLQTPRRTRYRTSSRRGARPPLSTPNRIPSPSSSNISTATCAPAGPISSPPTAKSPTAIATPNSNPLPQPAHSSLAQWEAGWKYRLRRPRLAHRRRPRPQSPHPQRTATPSCKPSIAN